MTEIKPKRQRLRVSQPSVDHLQARRLENARAMQVVEIKSLQDALNAIHKTVALSVHKRRKKATINHN